MHKIGNFSIIANFVFPFVCSFLLYLYHMIIVNVKLDVDMRIIFQDCRLHWSSSFSMAQLKRSWHYWHSCIEGLWNHSTFSCNFAKSWQADVFVSFFFGWKESLLFEMKILFNLTEVTCS